MFLQATSDNEIINIVNSNKNKTSVDNDDLSMSLLKKLISHIVKPLTYICNFSIESGQFPEKMKTAKVFPLFKSGDREKYTNCRPVSILPLFSKILEKLFVIRLNKFVEINNLLTDCQYGFRKNRSTSLALMELTEEISTAIDNKQITIGLNIDLKKAFDTINHNC